RAGGAMRRAMEKACVVRRANVSQLSRARPPGTNEQESECANEASRVLAGLHERTQGATAPPGRSLAPPAPSRGQAAAAPAIVYVIWGSTYLAIRYAIETLPPLLMAAARFFLAGGLLFAWARSRGVPMPTRRQWRACAVAGLLMLMAGNGAVVWAETRIASGVAALIVAIVPCWMVLFEWLSGGERPTGRVVAGLGLGLLGLGLLVGPEGFMGGGRIDLVGAAVLVLGG